MIVTEWVQFRALDLPRLKRIMKQPVVVDLRNIYRPDEMAELGFVYSSVGRGIELAAFYGKDLAPTKHSDYSRFSVVTNMCRQHRMDPLL